MKTELCELFEKYYSDKCPQLGLHSYSPIYYEYLSEYKETFLDIIEIGVGNKELMGRYLGENYQIGASLKAWRDFFVNASVYGLDIRKDVLFKEDRLACFYTDQGSEVELENAINEIKKYKGDESLLFDLIVDDGSHRFDHISTSFNCFSKYVKSGGFYIIEDVFMKKIDVLRERLNEKDFELVKIYSGSNSDGFVLYRKKL
jgi:8-demethyl-8-alpha-L-rhamnosyltetracenomycin-C 2'-O-methyltransferase